MSTLPISLPITNGLMVKLVGTISYSKKLPTPGKVIVTVLVIGVGLKSSAGIVAVKITVLFVKVPVKVPLIRPVLVFNTKPGGKSP